MPAIILIVCFFRVNFWHRKRQRGPLVISQSVAVLNRYGLKSKCSICSNVANKQASDMLCSQYPTKMSIHKLTCSRTQTIESRNTLALLVGVDLQELQGQPAKSCNFRILFFRSGKVWNLIAGHGKWWKMVLIVHKAAFFFGQEKKAKTHQKSK